MRRSLAALMGGVTLATLGGCGGGGGGTPQAQPRDRRTSAGASPGRGSSEEASANPMPSLTPPEGVLVGEILPPIVDDSERLTLARKQIETVNNAVLLYIAKHKTTPPSLEALAQPGI